MTNFGKYDLLERLASGGMAELFLARQTGVGGFSKTVVIKRIHKHLSADYEFTTMFINEARVSAQLSHQNIVQVYDFGEHDGSYFIAMEYVFGQDLKSVYKLCRKKRIHMPLPLAIYIVQQMCKGLDYAHRKRDSKGRPLDIVHRDVSPQNVLISYEGEVKIADFGIAKAASSSRMTQAGTLKGKIAYMSPEQAWGKTVDKRSDIFSIGIVFWEILTNQRLFYGSSDFDTLERVRNCDIPDITQVVPSISKEIDRILRKSLAKETETRYQNAAEMNHDLEVFSAAHGFYNQSPELANFLRTHFLQGEDADEISGSGSHPRVLTADGNIAESSQPIEVIDRNESSKGRIAAGPPPAGLPAVAQQVVAQARDAMRPPASRPIAEEDDTYQAPPLSEEFLQNVPAASRSPTPTSKPERSTELSATRRRAESTGSAPSGIAPSEGREPARRAPPQKLPIPVAASESDEAPAVGGDVSKRTTRKVAAAKAEFDEPELEAEADEEEWDEEEADEEEWDEEWEEADAPRSSPVVAILAVVLVVAILGVGVAGFFLLRSKGILLPPTWLPAGRLVVETVPDAYVSVGGDLKGTADASGKIVLPLIGGLYDLKISKKGYADWTKKVKIRPNRPFPVKAWLEPLRGRLGLTAAEPGVRVYVDGVYYGRTSLTPEAEAGGAYTKLLEYVPAGERTIAWSKAGRRDGEAKVTIEPDGKAALPLPLTEAPAEWVEVTVEANQKNAFAILDGELKGMLAPGEPLKIRLEQGIHDLVVVKAGFDPVVFRQKVWPAPPLKADLKPATETAALHVVTTSEGYDLLVDGREILRSIKGEATLPGIPQGKHVVQLVHPSLGSESQDVLVGERFTTVKFNLGSGSATKSQMEIVTRPSRATVLVDGKFAGISDLRMPLPKSEQFALVVTLPGYKRFERTFKVSEMRDKLEIELEKE